MAANYEEALNASLNYFNGDDLAAKSFVEKYALRDDKGTILEMTPDDMHRRLAREFARVEAKYPNPMSEEEIYSTFKNYKEIVPQGSPMSAVGNPYFLQSLSNCFVIPPPFDSYAGICKTDQEEAQIMKRRGGVGFDISPIRPRGLSTKNAARTTDGIGVFMERYSNTCREVAQNGRRGALMLSIDCHHPEILTFINIKKNKKKVTGANISVRWSDEFLHAVETGEKVQLRWPVEKDAQHEIEEWVDAKPIWDAFIEAAWESAEPGCLFWDTALRRTPSDCYAHLGYRSTSTNPCIVGSTLIAVADGRNAVAIKQLVEEGRDVPVYSTCLKTGQVQIKMGRNPRLTGTKKEVWKLTLDDGSTLIATPDHRVLLSTLEYRELKDLKAGDSIVPFYSFDNNGYRQVANTGERMIGGRFRNRRQYRLIAEFNGIAVDPKTHAIHHVDFDSHNDSVDNLLVMTHDEHRELHAAKMRGDANPYHRMSDDWKQTFASHPGTDNGRYSGHTNEEILEHGKKLFAAHGKITNQLWVEYAQQNGLPQYLSNDFRFGSFKNFANQVATNHKVVSVEMHGYEDVYNITVDDNFNYHVVTSTEDEKFVTSSGICIKNCGEIILSNHDSCRLILLNLLSFVDHPFGGKAKFNFKKFRDRVIKAQRLMDDLVDLELEAIDKIIAKILGDVEPAEVKQIELDLWQNIRKAAVNGRRTGLGLTAVGDAIAALGMRYGTAESVAFVEEAYKALCLGAYRSSVDLAKERGAFPIWDPECERGHPFLEQIWAADPELAADHAKHGRRNMALTTTAPAGTVSTQTQSTSGIEPTIFVAYVRRRKVNPSDKNVKVAYVDELGDSWEEYTVYHHGFKQWMEVTGKSALEESPYYKATANEIDWEAGVDLQAAAQKWICHAISRTTNLPNDVSKEVVGQVYWRGWKTGCKGITVYREGSRSGVLISEEEAKKQKGTDKDGRPLEVLSVQAPKRPTQLPCEIHQASVRGTKWTVFVGLLNGKPYEIFAGGTDQLTLPSKYKEGELIKVKQGQYDLHIDIGDGEELVVKNIVKTFDNPESAWATRMVSTSLRHGVPVEFICDQLSKDGGITDVNKVLGRILKKYIKDGKVKTGAKCQACGSTNIAYEEGCNKCLDCGSSKCG